MEDISHLEELILLRKLLRIFRRPANNTLVLHVCEYSYFCKSVPGLETSLQISFRVVQTQYSTETVVLWVTDAFNILALLCIMRPSRQLGVQVINYIFGMNLV